MSLKPGLEGLPLQRTSSPAPPAVSVIVATYNYGRYLACAINSILQQTFTDFEVIVVDDGSTDDTEDVIRQFLDGARIHYIRTGHVGQPAAKNTGAAHAQGEFLAFLDADDLWLPEKLERQIELLRRDPGLGLVYCRRTIIDPEGRERQEPEPELHRGMVIEEIFRNNFVCFSSSVIRRSVFEEMGRFDESIPLAIDYDLWLRVASVYRFDYVDCPLVKYRVGHANLSRRAEERLGIVEQIMRRFLDDRGGKGMIRQSVVRQSWAETYFHKALIQRRDSRLRAARTLLHAIRWRPSLWPAWKALLVCGIPHGVRKTLHRSIRPCKHRSISPAR